MLFTNTGSDTRWVNFTYVAFLDSNGLPLAFTTVHVNDSLDSEKSGNSLGRMIPGEEKTAVVSFSSDDFIGEVNQLRAISAHRIPLPNQ